MTDIWQGEFVALDFTQASGMSEDVAKLGGARTDRDTIRKLSAALRDLAEQHGYQLVTMVLPRTAAPQFLFRRKPTIH